MSDQVQISQLEERLLIQQTLSAFILAHLADEGLINLEVMKINIESVAILSGFREKALADLDRLFGTAQISLDLLEKQRAAHDDLDKEP